MKILIALLLIVAVQEPDSRAEFERLLPSNLSNLGHVPNLIFSDDEEAFLRGVRILHDLQFGSGDPERMVDLPPDPLPPRAGEAMEARARSFGMVHSGLCQKPLVDSRRPAAGSTAGNAGGFKGPRGSSGHSR